MEKEGSNESVVSLEQHQQQRQSSDSNSQWIQYLKQNRTSQSLESIVSEGEDKQQQSSSSQEQQSQQTQSQEQQSKINNSNTLIIKVHELRQGDALEGIKNEYKSLRVPTQSLVIDVIVLALKKWQYLNPEMASQLNAAAEPGISTTLQNMISSEGWELLQPDIQSQSQSQQESFKILDYDTPISSLLSNGDWFMFRRFLPGGEQQISPGVLNITSDYQRSLLFTPINLHKLDSRYPASQIKPAGGIVIPPEYWSRRYAAVGKDRFLAFFKNEEQSRWSQNIINEIDLLKVQLVEAFPIFIGQAVTSDKNNTTNTNDNTTNHTSTHVNVSSACGVRIQTRSRRIYLCLKTEEERRRFLEEIELIRNNLRLKQGKQTTAPSTATTKLIDMESLFIRSNSDRSTLSIVDSQRMLSPTQRLAARLEQSRRLNDIDQSPFDHHVTSEYEDEMKRKWNYKTNLALFNLLREKAVGQLKRLVEQNQLEGLEADLQLLNMLEDNASNASNASNISSSTSSASINTMMKRFIRNFSQSDASDSLNKASSQQQQSLLFGVTLEELAQRNHSPSSQQSPLTAMPPLVTMCLDYLTWNAINVPGLFRVAGSVKRVEQLKRLFEQLDSDSHSVKPLDFSPFNVHDVAGVLKMFLRDLPEPLLTRRLFRLFIASQGLKAVELRKQYLRLLVILLPPAHRNLLEKLLKFLKLVSEHADNRLDEEGNVVEKGNMMNTQNLAVVIGPNILRDNHSLSTDQISLIQQQQQSNAVSSSKSADGSDQNLNQMTGSDAVISVVRLMIEECEFLFIVPEDFVEELKRLSSLPMKYSPIQE